MPRSATGPTERRAAGFTLVELLVVVVIAGVLTGLVALRAFRDAPAARMERALDRVEVGLAEACDAALFAGAPMGLRLSPAGVDAWRYLDAAWVPLPPDRGPARVEFEPGWSVSIEVAGRPVSTAPQGPQVVCSGVEPPVPFAIRLRDGPEVVERRWPAESPG
ncbi:MAG: prepilin-type N-terminal cleavage/methylation domain-containing protein [Wenzhouxiangellaceae bacterium]|nr:prepilin-type N-terminal cleavage/methylation domain-containing protein [Wenzhouxiangellaceae bacterium]